MLAGNGVLSGTVFLDTNGNGSRDLEDDALPDQQVYLDLNENGLFDVAEPRVSTDAAGDYEFSDLVPGTYAVRLLPHLELKQTSPLDNEFVSTVVENVGDRPSSITGGDLDRDGDVDLVVANNQTNTLTILKNENGIFSTSAPATVGVGSGPSSVAIVNLNDDDGNGRIDENDIIDLAVANFFSDDVSILLGDGLGGFNAIAIVPAENGPLAISAPVESGGEIDLAVANTNTDTVVIFNKLDDSAFDTGNELFRYDPAGETAVLTADINKGSGGSSPGEITVFANKLFFRATDGSAGSELWKSDGSLGGTRRVADINPLGGSLPSGFTIFGNELYFSADDGITGNELWKTDGTEAGTVRLVDLNPGIGSSFPNGLTVFQGDLYFTANDGVSGDELWKTDGIEIVRVADLNPGAGGSFPVGFTALQRDLYFTANDGVSGNELWKTNGTDVEQVADIWPGPSSSSPIELTELDGDLYFRAEDGTTGSELWKTNGTNVEQVADISPGPGSSFPLGLTEYEGDLYFRADDGSTGSELWKTDGIDTVLVTDIRPGSGSSSPREFTPFGGELYFTADNSLGAELWKIGTGPPAIRITDLNPGAGSSFPIGLTVFQGALYFTANDGTLGNELWRTDGTEAGTLRLADLNPGAGSSFPSELTAFRGELYFSATAMTESTVLAAGDRPAALAVADLNQDELPDLVVANLGDDTISVLGVASSEFNSDDTQLIVSLQQSIAEFRRCRLELERGCFKAILDAIVGTLKELGISTPDRFARPVSYPTGERPVSLITEQLNDDNGDGTIDHTDFIDLAVANLLSNTVSFFFGDGTGAFSTPLELAAGKGPSSIKAVDMDLDGDQDLIVAVAGDFPLAILRNNGNRTFQATAAIGAAATGSGLLLARGDFPASTLALSLAVDDFDGDHLPDIAVADGEANSVSIFRNSIVVGAHRVSAVPDQVVEGLDFGLQPTNVPPTLNPLGPITIVEGIREHVIPLAAISAGIGEQQDLRVEATSDAPNFIGEITVQYSSPDRNGALILRPLPDQIGTATIVVTVTDAGHDGVFFTADDGQIARDVVVTVRPETTGTCLEDPDLSVVGQVGVSTSVEEEAEGYLYTYEITNPTTVPVFDFTLEFFAENPPLPDVDLVPISALDGIESVPGPNGEPMPPGWSSRPLEIAEGNRFASFNWATAFATGQPIEDEPVTFMLRSSLAPGRILYSVLGFDFVDTGGLFFATCSTIGPAVIDAEFLEADFNEDGMVDFIDFLVLSSQFNLAVDPPGTGADINGDGTVNFPDFLVLSTQFNMTSGGAATAPALARNVDAALAELALNDDEGDDYDPFKEEILDLLDATGVITDSPARSRRI